MKKKCIWKKNASLLLSALLVFTGAPAGAVSSESQKAASAAGASNSGKAAAAQSEKKTVTCKRSGNYLTVSSAAGKRKYRIYKSDAYRKYSGYYPSYGCVLSAVAISASAFGEEHSPLAIHTGSASKKYTEKYALKKLGYNPKNYSSLSRRTAISLRLASRILKDMGIKTKTVYNYSKKTALTKITSHLKKGKPVILKCNNRRINGVQIAAAHHALVLVGIDAKGYVSFIDTSTGKVNYAHRTKNTIKIKLKTLLSRHATAAGNDSVGPYVTSASRAGGYILVG